MAGWYELSKSKDDQFRFVLKAGNAETSLTSELYTTRVAAENGIASVQTNSPLAERYACKGAATGKPCFNLKAGNQQILGSNQMYASGSSRESGVASVKTNGPTITIRDLT